MSRALGAASGSGMRKSVTSRIATEVELISIIIGRDVHFRGFRERALSIEMCFQE